ncbi:hypothetical protein NP233_g7632 [Leucocoprinus birnbaumii]|uniref:DUF6699 domain-containing protein n=1 Tax=Leucocoprinus birnbaumii TaxID=56174 RepID=A0AAD5YNT6_9AGAR|nr:hypothetical protein NP233_g7632 [Leucocoprinus birnbaumii]
MATPYAYNMSGSQSPYQTHSPFIPPATLTSGSPYASPYGSPYRAAAQLPSTSPNTGGHIPLPGASYDLGPYPEYGPDWARPRRPSYHGPRPDDYVPSWVAGGRERRHSFNAGQGGWSSPYAPQSPGYWPPPQSSVYPQGYGQAFHLHPLLNGDSGRSPLIFDLSAPKFTAMKYLGPGHTEWLSPEELAEPATWPGLNRLRIECDLIPQWPIVFELDPSFFGGQVPPPGTNIPPITLGDVLAKIHDNFSQRISHIDWAKLSPQDEVAISKTYTTRCKAMGNAEAIERSQGVKRIDYALGKVWFRGLTRTGEGLEVLKLHLAKR